MAQSERLLSKFSFLEKFNVGKNVQDAYSREKPRIIKIELTEKNQFLVPPLAHLLPLSRLSFYSLKFLFLLFSLNFGALTGQMTSSGHCVGDSSEK